jgi:hypothetical protein
VDKRKILLGFITSALNEFILVLLQMLKRCHIALEVPYFETQTEIKMKFMGTLEFG